MYVQLSCYIRNSSTNALFTEISQLSYTVILQHQFVITKLFKKLPKWQKKNKKGTWHYLTGLVAD